MIPNEDKELQAMQFPQGRIPTKLIARRCPFCKKYPDTTMRHHRKYICDHPDNHDYVGPWVPKKERNKVE